MDSARGSLKPMSGLKTGALHQPWFARHVREPKPIDVALPPAKGAGAAGAKAVGVAVDVEAPPMPAVDASGLLHESETGAGAVAGAKAHNVRGGELPLAGLCADVAWQFRAMLGAEEAGPASTAEIEARTQALE